MKNHTGNAPSFFREQKEVHYYNSIINKVINRWIWNSRCNYAKNGYRNRVQKTGTKTFWHSRFILL